MGYDDLTADRIRRMLADRDDVVEKSIVGGGLGFMVGGHLCCAATVRGLTVRVGADAKAALLELDHVAPHTVGDRETSAFIIVKEAGYASDHDLTEWINRGLRFVDTLS